MSGEYSAYTRPAWNCVSDPSSPGYLGGPHYLGRTACQWCGKSLPDIRSEYTQAEAKPEHPDETQPEQPKFLCARDQVLYEMSQQAWAFQSDGTSDAPTGFFAWMSNFPSEVDDLSSAFRPEIEASGLADVHELLGTYLIVNRASEVYVQKLASEDLAQEAFNRLQESFVIWQSGSQS